MKEFRAMYGINNILQCVNKNNYFGKILSRFQENLRYFLILTLIEKLDFELILNVQSHIMNERINIISLQRENSILIEKNRQIMHENEVLRKQFDSAVSASKTFDAIQEKNSEFQKSFHEISNEKSDSSVVFFWLLFLNILLLYLN